MIKHLLAGAMLCAIAAGGLPQKSNAASFRIDAEGQPLLALPPLVTLNDPVFTHISVRHELIFDGNAFSSRIFFPEVQSYLVRLTATTFRWRTVTGDSLVLQPDVPTVVDGHRFLLQRSGPGEYVVQSDVTYRYVHGALRELEVGAFAYAYHYAGDDLQSIERTRPNRSTLVTFQRSAEGRTSTLDAGGTHQMLRFDPELRLIRVEGRAPEASMDFEYHEGLLVRARWHTGAAAFAWGSVADQYARFAIPHPPVIQDDGSFRYRIADEGRGVRVHFDSLSEKKSGEWYFDRGKRQLWMNGKLVAKP